MTTSFVEVFEAAEEFEEVPGTNCNPILRLKANDHSRASRGGRFPGNTSIRMYAVYTERKPHSSFYPLMNDSENAQHLSRGLAW